MYGWFSSSVEARSYPTTREVAVVPPNRGLEPVERRDDDVRVLVAELDGEDGAVVEEKVPAAARGEEA